MVGDACGGSEFVELGAVVGPAHEASRAANFVGWVAVCDNNGNKHRGGTVIRYHAQLRVCDQQL